MKDKFDLRKGVFKQAKVATDSSGGMTLVLPEIDENELAKKLPPVTIITITKNRAQFASLMLYNWINLTYPRDKLEWLILDDSTDTDYLLSDYIPQEDPYIRYVKLDKEYSIADKRNKAVELAKYDFIVHMDDDDFYFPDHVLAKIRLILHYNVQGVHSIPIGVYDLMEGSSYICDTTLKDGLNTNNIAEGTIAYRKEYWQNNKFGTKPGCSEGRSFINKHFNQWLNFHFLFNMISITHTKNVTGNSRRFINESLENLKTGKFDDIFPEDFKGILKNIKALLAAEYKRPTN